MAFSSQNPLWGCPASVVIAGNSQTANMGEISLWDGLPPNTSISSDCYHNDSVYTNGQLKECDDAHTPCAIYASTPSTCSTSISESTAGSYGKTVNLPLDSDSSTICPNQLSTSTYSKNTFTTEEERWEAMITRNPLADSHFYYLVPSTKIYCKPTCPSRRPIRHTVTYVTDSSMAVIQGYRPCKRCRPDQTLAIHDQRQLEAINRAQEIILARMVDDRMVLKLEDLAKEVGMSKYHFQRVFKKNVGLTPDGYAKSLQALFREQDEA